MSNEKAESNMEPYSNRELEHFFSDIKRTLGRIEDQTTKTNGRVNKLEQLRWMFAGALAVITFIVLPLVIYTFQTEVNVLKEQLQVTDTR